MNSNEILRSLRINHIFSILAAVIVIVTFETGVIAKDALGSFLSQTWTYILQVSAVMLTVLLIPLAVKGFTTSLDKAAGMGDEEFLKLFIRKSMQRIFLLFIALLLNLFVYYGLDYDGSFYCGLLALCSLVYSFPTRNVLEEYLEKNNGTVK
jgi:hypothetical protein